VIGLHVYIRLLCEQYCSSPDGDTLADSLYAQRSRTGPEALWGWVCIGL